MKFQQGPSKLFGLSQEKRQAIFKALSRAEKKARLESEAKYPFPNPMDSGYTQARVRSQMDKQLDLENQLHEKYVAQLRQKHEITEDQLSSITIEGVKKAWPY